MSFLVSCQENPLIDRDGNAIMAIQDDIKKEIHRFLPFSSNDTFDTIALKIIYDLNEEWIRTQDDEFNFESDNELRVTEKLSRLENGTASNDDVKDLLCALENVIETGDRCLEYYRPKNWRSTNRGNQNGHGAAN
jgi:hypothetical protein